MQNLHFKCINSNWESHQKRTGIDFVDVWSLMIFAHYQGGCWVGVIVTNSFINVEDQTDLTWKQIYNTELQFLEGLSPSTLSTG